MLPVYNFSPRKQYCISYIIVYGLIFKIWLNSSITKRKKRKSFVQMITSVGRWDFSFFFFFSTKLHLSKPFNGPHHSLYMASYHSATSLSSRLVSIQSNWNFKIASLHQCLANFTWPLFTNTARAPQIWLSGSGAGTARSRELTVPPFMDISITFV